MTAVRIATVLACLAVLAATMYAADAFTAKRTTDPGHLPTQTVWGDPQARRLWRTGTLIDAVTAGLFLSFYWVFFASLALFRPGVDNGPDSWLFGLVHWLGDHGVVTLLLLGTFGAGLWAGRAFQRRARWQVPPNTTVDAPAGFQFATGLLAPAILLVTLVAVTFLVRSPEVFGTVLASLAVMLIYGVADMTALAAGVMTGITESWRLWRKVCLNVLVTAALAVALWRFSMVAHPPMAVGHFLAALSIFTAVIGITVLAIRVAIATRRSGPPQSTAAMGAPT